MATLVQKGRLEFDRPPLAWIRQALTDSHVELVPFTPEIAVRAAGLGTNFPGDPADRLIVATAIESRPPLATKDDRLRRWGGVEISRFFGIIIGPHTLAVTFADGLTRTIHDWQDVVDDFAALAKRWAETSPSEVS